MVVDDIVDEIEVVRGDKSLRRSQIGKQ
jgi:hypothetical protein